MPLVARNLSCRIAHRLLFSQISFELGAGQWLWVSGANGSGKTTLLRMLCGLRSPDSGQVLWHGTAITRLGSAYHQDLAWQGHLPGFKDELSALENLALALAVKPHTPAQLAALFAEVGLSGQAHRQVRQFSAGMKRRLALARLLVTGAPLWVLDEPLTALDQSGISLLQTLIGRHLAQGGSVVLSSHQALTITGPAALTLELAQCA